MKNHARSLARWLLLPPALVALAGAFLAPAEAGRAPADAGPPARRAAQEEQEGEGRRRPEPPAASTVRGRVVYEESDRPVRRASVVLLGDGPRSEYSALTDARGEFSVGGVKAGAYLAFVDVPGALSPLAFVTLDDLRSSRAAMPDLGEGRAFFDVVEVDGKRDATVTVRARRGAAISGRVTYADGDPAVNVVINLMRRGADGRLLKFVTGANIVSLAGLRTDDRGVFRLTGLPPGEYFVAAVEPVEHGTQGVRDRRRGVDGMLEGLMRPQLLATFHPSAASAKEAAAVKVAAGEERADVDVRIPERELRAVSGFARARRGGRPLKGARVTIIRRDDPLAAPPAVGLDPGESSANSTITDEEGRWDFREIPDGPYTVFVKPAAEYEPGSAAANMSASTAATAGGESGGHAGYVPPRRKRGHAPARRDVEVSGDLSDVQVEAGEGARVAGAIRVEGGGPAAHAYVTALRVPDAGPRPAGEDGAHTAEADDGRFAFEGLPPGKFFLQTSTYAGEGRLYLKSITWNGKDITREPLELAEGATAEGVEIVFARDPAVLRLTASRARDGRPSLYAPLHLVPADATDAPPYSPRLLSCTTDDDGSCVVIAPPGEYHVVAQPPGSAAAALERELRRRAPLAPRVSLRAGEKKDFAVVVPDR